LLLVRSVHAATASLSFYFSHTPSSLFSSFVPLPPPPTSTLFPYTTLFRSIIYSKELLQPRCLAPMESFSVIGATIAENFNVELRSEEHTSELQSRFDLVCRLLLEKKKNSTARRVT